MNCRKDRTVKSKFKRSCLSLFTTLFLAALCSAASASADLASSPEEKSKFCVSCHTMEAEYTAWTHSSHHRKMCVDCHLPNENKAVYYLWKSLDGLKDVLVFYSGTVPDRIKISAHGEKVLQANCIRCHETTVMMIDRQRKCWDCHRRISHMHTGIRVTF